MWGSSATQLCCLDGTKQKKKKEDEEDEEEESTSVGQPHTAQVRVTLAHQVSGALLHHSYLP